MNSEKSIVLDKKTYNYKLIKSKRKSIVIKITSFGKIEVRAPLSVTDKYINDFLNKKKNWIIKNIDHIKEMQMKDEIYFLGNKYKFRFVEGVNNNIIIDKNELTIVHSKRQTDKEALIDICKKEFIKIIKPVIYKNAKLINVYPEKVNIKILKSRWGSCSSKGNLNFNLCLIGAPISVIEYVIIHELCHMKEMNHSKKFWALVGNYCDNYKKCEFWLKNNGTNLINIFI